MASYNSTNWASFPADGPMLSPDGSTFEYSHADLEPWNPMSRVTIQTGSFAVNNMNAPENPWDQSWTSSNSSTCYSPSMMAPSLTDGSEAMSRNLSHSSSFDFNAAHEMRRVDSGYGNYSFASNNQQSHGEPYVYSTASPLSSLAEVPSSPTYLLPPLDMRRSLSSHSNTSSISSTHSYAQQLHYPANSDGKVALPTLQSPNSSMASSRRREQRTEFTCNKCNDRPQGFRGEHELMRHVKLRHSARRSVWICVAPPEDPNFLAGCKHCKATKQYGAYYNAAQHIRRVHISPTKRGRRSKADIKAERAGQAKACASDRKNWPNMDTMKQYLREVVLQGSSILDVRPASNRASHTLMDDSLRCDSTTKNKAYSSSVTVKEQYNLESDNAFDQGFDFSGFQIEDPAATTSAGWHTANATDVLLHVNGGHGFDEYDHMPSLEF